MKKIASASLAAAFLAVSLIPATAATKTTAASSTKMAMPAKMTMTAKTAATTKPDHKMGNPAKKLAKGVKKDVCKMDKAVKKSCSKKHSTSSAPAASAKKTTKAVKSVK